jgi:hypothetical protein
MEHAEDHNGGAFFRHEFVDDNVWQPSYDPFSGATRLPTPTGLRKVPQHLHGRANRLLTR